MAPTTVHIAHAPRKVGAGAFVYEELTDWSRLPAPYRLGEVAGVAVNSQDLVYLFCRTENPVVILDRNGRWQGTWGEGMFARPHLIFIGPDDSVYCVDDVGHRVKKFTPDGKLLLELKPLNGPADTGYVPGDSKSVVRAGPPFNRPTDVALSPTGEIYVTDGYGNARVHKYSRDGELLLSWGEPGAGPGQFEQIHGVCVDPRGRVYVADRKNTRIQIFSPEGAFEGEWKQVWWPCAMCLDPAGNMYVAEVGGTFMFGKEARLDQPAARITVRNPGGVVLAEWSAEDAGGVGRFFAPHDIAIDSHGDLYAGEVVHSYSYRQAPADAPVLRKFVRVA